MSAKYFYKNKNKFFFGLEFRYKNYTYTESEDFENKLTADTLLNYSYKLENTLLGGAVFFGRRFKISGNGKFEIEAIGGIGAKYRSLIYNDVPAGYKRIEYEITRGSFQLYPLNYFYNEQWLPYFPIALKLVYHF